MVDPVTKSLLSDFLSSQQIATPSEPEQFEHFVNYVVMFDLFPEEFDVEDIATGAGEFGLDGLAIIVNDTIIVDEEQLEDLADNSSSLTVQFVFTQAKSAKSFNAGELSQFLLAVNDFFGERMAFVQGEKVQTLHRIKNKLYGYAPKFVRGLPRLSLHYATTGTWQSDPNLIAVRDAHLITLREKHMFSQVDFLPIDAARLQKLYFQTKTRLKSASIFKATSPCQ
ncbi:hypothetical protein MBRA_04065 [Methylobacterium brachiatum]|nr:hypothetical protein MBRA_04065 [Methylobacterium brachiatum]